jgi:membrane-associated protease RseP (regulator of RpoE activity)
MNRNLAIVAVAVCVLWPASAQTQETRPRSRPRVRIDGGPYSVFTFDSNRGRIGIIVDTRANTTGDKTGARVEGITPGGPAEKAGLKAGDVITRFNGTALGGVAAENDEDSGPGMKLIELARELDPGDTVQVEYRRGTEAAKKLTLVAEDLGGDMMVRTFPRMPGMGGEMFPDMHMGGPELALTWGRGPWGGIEMVKLNPDLGEYFGTREGLLVVDTPEDSSLKLKAGDVIQTIGGRKPSSPMHAMRILGSYEPGETVALQVFRKRAQVTVSYKVPERRGGDFYYKTPDQEPSRFELRPKIEAPQWKIRDVVRVRAQI